MKKQTVCPKTKAPCRFCSNESERQIRRFSDLKTSREGKKIVYVDKGEFCNNDGRHYIKDLKECPVLAALAAPLVPHVIDERTWMRVRSFPDQIWRYPKYLTVEEVANIMRMSVRNIQKLCNEGKLHSTKTGKSYLIPQESLDEYLKIRRG